MANENIDPVNILVNSIRSARFENRALGDAIRSLAETIQSDLESLNYKPDKTVFDEAKEVAVILVSSITGTDRLNVIDNSDEKEEEEEEDTGTRLGFRDSTEDDDEEEKD